MELFGVPFLNEDLYKMLIKFSINLLFMTIIIRQLYYKYSQRTEYVFTYFMVSLIVFFLCFTLNKFAINLGMALGLFAIFGIIRYRTQTIHIKEMTYLFVVIGISVINAMSNESMSYAEILGLNTIVVVSIYVMERYMLTQHGIQERSVIYSKLDNIKPENYDELISDLKQKTGLEVKKVKVDKVDYANQLAFLTIQYIPVK